MLDFKPQDCTHPLPSCSVSGACCEAPVGVPTPFAKLGRPGIFGGTRLGPVWSCSVWVITPALSFLASSGSLTSLCPWKGNTL